MVTPSLAMLRTKPTFSCGICACCTSLPRFSSLMPCLVRITALYGTVLYFTALYCSVLQCTAVYNQGLMPVMLAWQYSALSQCDILFLWWETELLTWQSECWLLVGDVVISPPGTAARLESCLQWPGLLMIQFRRSLSSLASCGFRFLCWTLSSHIHIQYILEKIKKSNDLEIVDSGHFLFEFNDRQNIKIK